VADLKLVGVRPGLDTLLRLVPIMELEESLNQSLVLNQVRSLEIHLPPAQRSAAVASRSNPVEAALFGWKRDQSRAHREIVRSLGIVATRPSGEVWDVSIIEPVRHPGAKGVLEVKSMKEIARVFVFEDVAASGCIVAVGSYSKCHRSKQEERESQNAAILNAAMNMRLWQDAKRVPGIPNWRYIRRGETR